MEHPYDIITIGVGLPGLRVTIEIGDDANVAVHSKVIATRSQSGAAFSIAGMRPAMIGLKR